MTPVEPELYLPTPPARLRTDVFLTFGGKALTLAFGFATVAVVARELGPGATGTFLVAYSLSLLLLQVGALGLTSANPYFVAREPNRVGQIIANSVWLAGGLGILLVFAGAALKLVAPGALEGLSWAALGATLIAIPGALAAYLLQSILLGEGRMVGYNAVEAGGTALTLLGVIAGFALFGFGITGTLLVLAASRYVAAGTYLVLLLRRTSWAGRLDWSLARRMSAYGFRVYVSIVLSYLIVRFDLLLVNGYLGRTEAGLYGIAATLADGLFVVPTVIGLNLFPRVARGDPTQASAEVFRSVAVLFGVLCLLSVPVAGPAIRIFFGDSYSGATSLYYWLLPGIFAYGMVTILSGHFAGRGFPRAVIVFWIFGFGLNVALNVIFLPGRGAWVAALTSSITYAVLLALHMWLFAREAGGYGVMRPRAREVVRFVRVALSKTG